jgi:hypothetical protein
VIRPLALQSYQKIVVEKYSSKRQAKTKRISNHQTAKGDQTAKIRRPKEKPLTLRPSTEPLPPENDRKQEAPRSTDFAPNTSEGKLLKPYLQRNTYFGISRSHLYLDFKTNRHPNGPKVNRHVLKGIKAMLDSSPPTTSLETPTSTPNPNMKFSAAIISFALAAVAAAGNVVELNNNNFDDIILRSGQPALVEFYTVIFPLIFGAI